MERVKKATENVIEAAEAVEATIEAREDGTEENIVESGPVTVHPVKGTRQLVSQDPGVERYLEDDYLVEVVEQPAEDEITSEEEPIREPLGANPTNRADDLSPEDKQARLLDNPDYTSIAPEENEELEDFVG